MCSQTNVPRGSTARISNQMGTLTRGAPRLTSRLAKITEARASQGNMDVDRCHRLCTGPLSTHSAQCISCPGELLRATGAPLTQPTALHPPCVLSHRHDPNGMELPWVYGLTLAQKAQHITTCHQTAPVTPHVPCQMRPHSWPNGAATSKPHHPKTPMHSQ